ARPPGVSPVLAAGAYASVRRVVERRPLSGASKTVRLAMVPLPLVSPETSCVDSLRDSVAREMLARYWDIAARAVTIAPIDRLRPDSAWPLGVRSVASKGGLEADGKQPTRGEKP